jgi:hypothetical protein
VGVKPKVYGRITFKSGEPMSFALIKIFSPETNIEITRRVADRYGRYYCLVSPGKYYVKIEKKNEDGSYSGIYTSSIIDASKKGIIKNNFKC